MCTHELYSSGEFDIKLARIRHRHLSRKLEITSSAETMKQCKFQPTHLLIFFWQSNSTKEMSRVTQIISQLFGIPTQQNQKLTHSWEEVPVCTII